MSRPCVISEVLSVFIRETEPILLFPLVRERRSTFQAGGLIV